MATFKPGPKSLTILTPELSRRARRELGLSQSEAIKASGIKAYKLKHWESAGLALAGTDLRMLGDFYEGQGVNLTELAQHVGQGRGDGAGENLGAYPQLQDGFTYAPRPGFFISTQHTDEMVDAFMVRMEANDDRIAFLISEAFKTTGFFGSVSEDTEAKARELVACLAENHVIFRALQGRNIVSVARDEPKTIGDYLGKMLEALPILPMIVAEPEGSLAKRTRKPKGERVTAELEG